jgi:hypothetical protein
VSARKKGFGLTKNIPVEFRGLTGQALFSKVDRAGEKMGPNGQ